MTSGSAAETGCAIYVDLGTTNARAWLARGDRVVARARRPVGVRDTARDGSNERVRAALRELITETRAAARDVAGPGLRPSCVVAAGMITSPQGLVEVPHVAAPAGAAELASAVQRHNFPDITELPILLVPGVRCGPARCGRETIGAADVIRGEETLCVGLATLGLLDEEAALLNLGSHWKVIRLDGRGRVAASTTSLAGELVHAAQTQTILASAVPPERPEEIDPEWLEAGMGEQRRSGLGRALFCVRLLEQRVESTPAERCAFLVGAFIAAELDALVARRALTAGVRVVVAGGGALAEAWGHALSRAAISATALTEPKVEQALLAGLRLVAARAGAGRGS